MLETNYSSNLKGFFEKVEQIVFTFLFIWVYVSGLENVCISCQEIVIKLSQLTKS